MDKQKIWSIVKLLLKVGVTGLSLFLVFKKVDPKDLREALNDSDPLYLVVAFIFFLISQIISSSRLRNFFSGIGLNLNPLYNFKIYLLGMFYNLFLPGGIGGDGYKIFLLRKRFNKPTKKLFWAIFFDRLSGLWAVGLIISALVIFIPYLGIPNWIPIIVVAAGTMLYYLVLKKLFPDYTRKFIRTHLKAILVQSMQLIAVIFILYSLNFQGKFAPYLFMFLISSLVAIFPFTVGGLGAREIVFVYGAQYMGFDEHLAVLISLVFYIISAVLSFSGIYFVFNPQALGEKTLKLE
jgi:glycosyltransferase 2 family protein